MNPKAGLLLIAFTASATAQIPAAQPMKVADARCIVTFKGRYQRSAVQLAPGTPPVSAEVNEEFAITVPGRLEQWAPVPTAAEFRFIPDPGFSVATGSFKTRQTVIKPMQQTKLVVEGANVGGMGTWYLHAGNLGGQIVPQNLDITMRGKVMESDDPNLRAGRENVPVSVVVVPLLAASSQQLSTPPLQFRGPSLWTLAKTKTPFTAQADIMVQQRAERASIRGSLEVMFQVDPTK